jgi:hypothetical protein
MKRIIDGKAYNTETATLLGSVILKGTELDEQGRIPISGPSVDAGTSSLYQTRGAAYFIVREVKDGFYAQPDSRGGSRPYIIDSGLYPLARKEALAWAEHHKIDAERIEAMFGEFPEAGIKEKAILLRIPDVLKKRAEQAAGDADQSVNAWALRCLELCANLDEIKDHVARMAWIARSHTARPDERAFSREAMGEMLTEIAAEAETVGGLLGVADWFGQYAGTQAVEDIAQRFKPYNEDGGEFTD